MSLGRTKAAAVVKGVLAPFSIEIVVKQLKSTETPSQKPPFFSIATDGSTKWTKKIYPHAIRFFDINAGVQDRILHFEESLSGTSEGTYFNRTAAFNFKI